MNAGNDMLQPGLQNQYDSLIVAAKSGVPDDAVLSRNVKRILEIIMKTPRFKGYKYSNKPDLKAHAAVTRQSATEGMVLLKNQQQCSSSCFYSQEHRFVRLYIIRFCRRWHRLR